MGLHGLGLPPHGPRRRRPRRQAQPRRPRRLHRLRRRARHGRGGHALESRGGGAVSGPRGGREEARSRNFPGIGYWTAKAAFLHPDRIALVTPEGRRSYRDLEVGVAEATSILRGLGVESGRSFGILMWNDARFLDLLFAAGRTGGVAVPLNWRLTAAELAFQVEDAGIETVFVGAEQEELAAELEAATGCRLLRVPEVFDGSVPAAAGPAGSAPAGRSPGAEAPVPPPPMSSLPGDDDPVLMVYTSGTTGRPKGALLTHRNLFWNAINDVLALGLTWQDTSLTILPLMHAGGIGLFTLPTLLAGGTVVMPRRFDPEETLELIGQEKVTVMMGVPATHGMLVDAAGWDAADLSSLRFAYNGGDRCPPAVEARFRERGILFAGGYGLTETAPTAFLTELDQADDARRLDAGAGKPSFGMDARIVDADGRDVAPGEVGEVVLQGPNLFLGYHGRPDATAEAFRGGWFRTGDLASWTAQGFTSIAGRSKQMLKSGGENIYPAEVEQALLEHPAVAEACVIGRPHPRWNEVPFAVVALRAALRDGNAAGQAAGLAVAADDELRTFLEARLARFKIPAGFAFVDALPRTSIGKPDRPLLERTFGAALPDGEEDA
ncbi:MAG: acyl-CoA synthetase [Gemmatimonadales bacterium]|nr:MAG: acyl-CoA synthetase [Gemmatimonadales bacterium]